MPQVIVRDGKAQLINPAGGTVEVPVAEAAAALKQGYSAQSPEQYNEAYTRRERSSLGQKAITVGEGALEGATLGLGTAVAAELGGDEYREAALERRAVNPGSHVTGQVAGAVLPSLASGGGSLGARALAGIGAPARLSAAGGLAAGEGAAALVGAGGGALRGAARTAVKYGTAGAVEGAAYGLGTSLADSALEDTDWTADRALAGMRDGALFGLAGGGVVGGLGSLAGSGGRKLVDLMLEGKTLKQAAREYASGKTIQAVVARDQKTWNRLTKNGAAPEHIEEVAKEIRDRGIDRLPEAEQRAALAQVKREYGEKLDAIIRHLDERPRRNPEPVTGELAPEDIVARLPRPTREVVEAQQALRAREFAELPPEPLQAKAAHAFSWGYDDTIRKIQRGVPEEKIIADRTARYGGPVDKTGMDHAAHVEAAKQYARDVESFIANRPKTAPEDVYRGIVGPKSVYEKFLKNDAFDLGGMTTSASYDPQVGRSFVARYHDPANAATEYGVTLKLRQKSGVAIDNIAEKPIEREVLLPGNSRYEVTARYADPTDPKRLIVEATEVPQIIRPDMRALREELQTKVLNPLTQTGSGTDARIARGIERELKGFFKKVDSGADITFADLRKFKQGIGKAHSDALTKPATAREMDRVYAIVSKHIDDAAVAAGPETADAWRKANQGYSDFETLSKGFQKKASKEATGRFTGYEDRLAGYETGIAATLLTGNPAVGFFTRLATAPAYRLLQDRGNAAMGRIANWVAEYEGRIANAAQVAARLKPLSALPATVASRAGLAKGRNEKFEQIQKKLDELETDPRKMTEEIERVIGPIAGEQPEVAMKMAVRMQEDAAWLRTKLPSPVGNYKFASLTPHLTKPGVVSSRDKQRVVAYAEAIADPASVLEDVARGNINWDGITALKERRPEQWEAVRMAVATATAQAKNQLPYRTQVLYGLAFDFNSNPAFMQIPILQSAFVPLPGAKPGPSSNPDMSVNETETPYQKAVGE